MAWVGFIFYASTTPRPFLFLLPAPPSPKKKKEISKKKMRAKKKKRYDFYSFFSLRSDRVVCVSRSLSLWALMILFSLPFSLSHLFEEYTRCARETDALWNARHRWGKRPHGNWNARGSSKRERIVFFILHTPPSFFERETIEKKEKLRTYRCEQRGGGGRSDGRLGELLRQVGRLDRLVDRTVLKVRERLMRDGEYYYFKT